MYPSCRLWSKLYYPGTSRFRNSIEKRRRYNTCIETWRITNRKIALFVFRWREKISTGIIPRLSLDLP